MVQSRHQILLSVMCAHACSTHGPLLNFEFSNLDRDGTNSGAPARREVLGDGGDCFPLAKEPRAWRTWLLSRLGGLPSLFLPGAEGFGNCANPLAPVSCAFITPVVAIAGQAAV